MCICSFQIYFLNRFGVESEKLIIVISNFVLYQFPGIASDAEQLWTPAVVQNFQKLVMGKQLHVLCFTVKSHFPYFLSLTLVNERTKEQINRILLEKQWAVPENPRNSSVNSIPHNNNTKIIYPNPHYPNPHSNGVRYVPPRFPPHVPNHNMHRDQAPHQQHMQYNYPSTVYKY